MDVFKMFNKEACDIRGKTGSDKWTRQEYFSNKEKLNKQGIQVVLVDMIGQPIDGALPISNELFMSGKYPKGTYFVLYCHSGGSSGYVQKQLKTLTPQYNIINMDGGIYAYQIYRMNN